MKFLNSVWLDEVGVKFGVYRSKKETIEEYENRIYERISQLPEPTKKYLFEHIGNDALLKKEVVFKVYPKKALDDYGFFQILPPSPMVLVNGAWLKVWSDSNSEPILSLNIWDKDGAYFLKDIYEELSKLEDFEVSTTYEDDSWMYKKSSNLISATSELTKEVSLLPIRVNRLGATNLKKVIFGNSSLFANEVSAHEDILKDGDYYINYYEGIVHSFLPAGGRCMVFYNTNPIEISWHPIGVMDVNDEAIDDIFKDHAVGTEGQLERLILNSQGANIINKILSVHPLQWGK